MVSPLDEMEIQTVEVSSPRPSTHFLAGLERVSLETLRSDRWVSQEAWAFVYLPMTR